MFQLGCWRLKHHRPLGGLVPRPSSRSSVPEGLEQHIDPGKVPAHKAPRNLTSYRQRAGKVEVNTCDSACSPPCCYSCCQSLLIAALPILLVCLCAHACSMAPGPVCSHLTVPPLAPHTQDMACAPTPKWLGSKTQPCES